MTGNGSKLIYYVFCPFLLKVSHVCIDTSSTAQGGGGSFKNRKPIGEIDCCESPMTEQKH